MTKGPHRLVLDSYIDTASEGALKGAGYNWTRKAKDLDTLGAALKKAAEQAELQIGEQTLTGPAVRASMEESAASLTAKSQQLRAAGTALTHVGQQLADTRESRDSLADLGAKPSPYQPPAGTPGVEPTSEEIQAQADASQARSNERGAWQTQYDKQEAKSLALTKEMDAAFLAAIPPMKEIHGQKDPTEPPPNVPSGPGGPYLPGTQAPPATGGGGNGGGQNQGGVYAGSPVYDGNGNGGNGNGNGNGNGTDPTPTTTPTPGETPPRPPLVHTEGPTSTVTGTAQDGVGYQPTGPQVSAPTGSGGPSAGASAAALGAAGGAGGLAAGATRPGPATGRAASSSAPVRAIGSTGRAGSAGAISRSAGTTGSSAAGRGAGSTGSGASRSPGSAAGKGASTGSGAARGASTGSSAGRGGAGGRGAGSAGSRSGGRGSSGARSGGAGTGSRGGRKGEREQTTDRDSLVYDQDWLGDDDVAPGVLD